MIRILNSETGIQIGNEFKGHNAAVKSVCFSSDGRKIASGSEDKLIRIWNAEIEKELLVLNGHTHPVNTVKFSSDSKTIISGSNDKSIKIWSAITGK